MSLFWHEGKFYCTGVAHPPVQVTKKRKAATKDCTVHKMTDRSSAKCAECYGRLKAMPGNVDKSANEIKNLKKQSLHGVPGMRKEAVPHLC